MTWRGEHFSLDQNWISPLFLRFVELKIICCIEFLYFNKQRIVGLIVWATAIKFGDLVWDMRFNKSQIATVMVCRLLRSGNYTLPSLFLPNAQTSLIASTLYIAMAQSLLNHAAHLVLNTLWIRNSVTWPSRHGRGDCLMVFDGRFRSAWSFNFSKSPLPLPGGDNCTVFIRKGYRTINFKMTATPN